MASELDPRLVVERLSALRRLFVAETVEEARERLSREHPRPQESIEQVAQRSLDELRVLCELARVLHAAVPRPADK